MLVSLAFIKHLTSYNNSMTLAIQYPHFTEEGIKAKRSSPTCPDHADNIKGATVFQEICLLSERSTGGWLAMPGGSLEQKDKDHKCINIAYQKICSHTVKSGSTQWGLLWSLSLSFFCYISTLNTQGYHCVLNSCDFQGSRSQVDTK